MNNLRVASERLSAAGAPGRGRGSCNAAGTAVSRFAPYAFEPTQWAGVLGQRQPKKLGLPIPQPAFNLYLELAGLYIFNSALSLA